jgi:hypothetical protein
MKVIGSTTVMTRKEQRFYRDRREVECQNRRHEKALIFAGMGSKHGNR